MRQKGFTLLELMVTIAVLAILVTIAMPNYRNFMDTQRTRSALNEWQSAYYFAQREAMRLKQPVIFCGSEDGLSCWNNQANDFSKGWIVYYGTDNNKVILQDKALHAKDDKRNVPVSIKMNNPNVFKKNGLKFMANGSLRSGASTLTVQSVNSNIKAIEVSINLGGRLSVKKG